MLQGSGKFVCSLPAGHHIGMGEKVRTLKGQKAEKAVIRAEVTKLLELKKRQSLAEGKNPELAPTKGTKNTLPAPTPANTAQAVRNGVDIERARELTLAVAEQGEKVRTLKGQKAREGCDRSRDHQPTGTEQTVSPG